MPYDDTLILDYCASARDVAADRPGEHLVGLAVTMTRGCQVCTRGRIEKARRRHLR